MPTKIIYRPIIIDSLITNARLNSYGQVFTSADDAQLVGAYLWNAHACAAIYPLISAAEITLRNAIDSAIFNKLGAFWWDKTKLHYKSYTAGQNAPDVVISLRNNLKSGYNKARKDKLDRYGISNHLPSHQEVIAKTEFSTWEYILDREFMGPNLIWPSLLGKVFTGNWNGRNPGAFLDYAKSSVKTVREFRNRIFHHEPAWKRHSVYSAADAMAVLHEKIAKIEELIGFISAEKIDLLQKTGLIENAKRACSIHELERYQYKKPTHSIKTVGKLIRIADDCHLENKPTLIWTRYGAKRKFLLVPQ